MLGLQQINAIGRTYRDLKRYKQILQILFKYGFGDVVQTLHIEQYVESGVKFYNKWTKKHQDIASAPKIEEYTRPERVRMALEELGPTFIKLGQVLSTRPDLIPIEYTVELEKLQDKVPSFPYEQVREIIKEELGDYPETLFKEFDPAPFAAASIGQVHRATLEDGTNVVVKTQRPGIKAIITVDLEIMMHLAGLMERNLKAIEVQKPTAIVREFARVLEKEINYKTELFHMERFRSMFESAADFHVPVAYKVYCSERVLTMEFIKGVKASDVDALKRQGCDLKRLACLGAESLMSQIFVHGFFHGDPHPGNIFVLEDGRICFLDFGMMGRVSHKEREEFADFIIEVITRNEHRLTECVLKLTYYDKEPDAEFERELVEIVDEQLYRPLKEIDTGELLEQVMNTLTKYGLRLKPNLFLMLKALISIDRVAKNLDPDLEILQLTEPYIRNIRLKRLDPISFVKNAIVPLSEFFRLLNEIPSDFHVLLKQLKEGNFKMEFQHRGLEPLRETLNQVSNRIAFAIVLAALIIGHALITLSRFPEKWHMIHTVGLLGFIGAGLIGFWLLILMIRGGKF